VLDCTCFKNKESIFVTHEEKDLFFVFPEFHKNGYSININCIVFSDLPTSKAAKLRAIYKSEGIADYISEAGADLWFLNDKTFVMSYILEQKYSNYAILKSQLLLDIYINVQNAKRLNDKLEVLLAELEQIRVN